jgi:hypothetical protein
MRRFRELTRVCNGLGCGRMSLLVTEDNQYYIINYISSLPLDSVLTEFCDRLDLLHNPIERFRSAFGRYLSSRHIIYMAAPQRTSILRCRSGTQATSVPHQR